MNKITTIKKRMIWPVGMPETVLIEAAKAAGFSTIKIGNGCTLDLSEKPAGERTANETENKSEKK